MLDLRVPGAPAPPPQQVLPETYLSPIFTHPCSQHRLKLLSYPSRFVLILSTPCSDTSEERLRFLLIDSRPDIWTVLFNFAKRRDAFGAGGDADSPRVRREVTGR